MKSMCHSIPGLLALLILLGPQTAQGQSDSVYTLGFGGPDALKGTEGATVPGAYDCTLTQENGTTAGAQGWSISVLLEGATMVTFTTEGSDVPDYYAGGFNKTQVVDPGKNGGKQGAVSAVVLSFTQDKQLPVNSTKVIGKAGIKAVIPAVVGTARLVYENGLVGAGQPVSNAITEAGDTKTPVLGEKLIDVVPVPSCCQEPLNVGFSGTVVSSSLPFDRISNKEEDPGTPVCQASGGEIVVEAAEGTFGLGHVYANIISQLVDDPPGGAQGWSFSIAFNGDMNMKSLTTAGTSVDTYYAGGFNKTQAVDPAKNGGQRGVVSAVVLSFTQERELPMVGTQSLLNMGVESSVAQGDDDTSGELKFLSGLVGAGQPVSNAITLGGSTWQACNVEAASVNVVFRKVKDSPFIRGNANDDGKVDIADPIWIINELFRGGPATLCKDAADANNDGVEDSADAVFLINYLFRSESAPAAPFEECGLDPEADADGMICETKQRGC